MSDSLNKSAQGSELIKVLGIRSFLTVWLSQIITQISYNMLTFVLGVQVYEMTRSNAQVSLLFLAVGMPAALFGIVSGVLVDSYRKKNVLLFSTLGRIPLLLLLLVTHENAGWVFLTAALFSMITQLFMPAQAALIPKIVPRHLLLSANSLFTLTFYSAIIGGFVAGGPLLSSFGFSGVVQLLIWLCFFAAGLLLFFPAKADFIGSSTHKLGNMLTEVKEVLVYIRRSGKISQAILLMTLAQAIISVFLTLGPGFADRILSIKLTDASIVILGPAAVGMIFGALFIGQYGVRFSRRSLIKSGIFLSAGLLLFLGAVIRFRRYQQFVAVYEDVFSNSLQSGLLPLSILIFFLLGLANSLIDISCNTVIQEQTDDRVRGRVYGVLTTLVSGVALLPVVLSGWLADVVGVGKIIFFLGFALLFFGILARYEEVKQLNN